MIEEYDHFSGLSVLIRLSYSHNYLIFYGTFHNPLIISDRIEASPSCC